MSLNCWDLGEIVRNYIYVREIQPFCSELLGTKLLASKELFKQLAKVYDYLGIAHEPYEINVKIKLPSNPNSEYSKKWHFAYLEMAEERPMISILDSLSRYLTKEVVLASDKWLCAYESFPGDDVIISPCLV